MWREIIKSAIPGARLAKAATASSLGRAETALSVSLPPDLRALLRETNGAGAPDGFSIVWGIGEIVDRNRGMREPGTWDDLYQPFDSLLFFGEDGNGDLFGYRMDGGADAGPPIIRWDHETDERSPLAVDLEEYLRLRGLGEPDEDEIPAEPTGIQRRVSVWVGTHESEEDFGTYLANGFLYAACLDSEGLSRFENDAGLRPDDLHGISQQIAFSPEGEPVAGLLEGVEGHESLSGPVTVAARRHGIERATTAVLLYRLHYDPAERPTATPGPMTFLGCFEYE
jgi:hypothetical protein